MTIQANNVCKSFIVGGEQIRVLTNTCFVLERGKRAAIIGRSGSGKSTLLSLLGGLDTCDQGEIWLDGQPLHTMGQRALTEIRNNKLGFVYQMHYLLSDLTAVENVALPLYLAKDTVKNIASRASTMLKKVGLSRRLQHTPAQLSGGERQRVAIARALVNNPSCVLLDEPTGNLDAQAAADIEELLVELTFSQNTSFVLVTHDLQIAKRMDEVHELKQGVLTQVAVDKMSK